MTPFTALLAEESARDAFVRSMSEHTRGSTSVDGFVLVQVLLTTTVLVLAAVAAKRYVDRRRNPPKVRFHNAHKLEREMARQVPLSPADIRKLEYHAARMGIKNPLTLLLCPSLLEKAGISLATPPAEIPLPPPA